MNGIGMISTSQAGATLLPQTIRERLEQQKVYLTTKLSDVQAVLKLIDENPKLEEFHNAVTKANIGLY